MALVSNIGIYIGIYNNMMPHDSNITRGWVGGGKSDFMISGKLVVICKGKGICAADCWYLYPRQVAPAAAAAVAVGRAESLLLQRASAVLGLLTSYKCKY